MYIYHLDVRLRNSLRPNRGPWRSPAPNSNCSGNKQRAWLLLFLLWQQPRAWPAPGQALDRGLADPSCFSVLSAPGGDCSPRFTGSPDYRQKTPLKKSQPCILTSLAQVREEGDWWSSLSLLWAASLWLAPCSAGSPDRKVSPVGPAAS